MSNNLCAHKNCLILALGHCLNGVTVIYCNAIKTVIYHAFFFYINYPTSPMQSLRLSKEHTS